MIATGLAGEGPGASSKDSWAMELLACSAMLV